MENGETVNAVEHDGIYDNPFHSDVVKLKLRLYKVGT